MAKFLRISLIMMLAQAYALAHVGIGLTTSTTNGCWWALINPEIIIEHPVATMICAIIIVMACTTVIIRAALSMVFDSVEKTIAHYEHDRS